MRSCPAADATRSYCTCGGHATKGDLFDEPTSSLDPDFVREVFSVPRSLAEDGMTMMVVTHKMLFAREAAERVLLLDSGGIVEKGPAKEVLTEPKHPRTEDFLRRVLNRF